MKIEKFNENLSNDDRTYYLFIEQDNFDNYYLFKEYEDAYNWITNIVYTFAKKYNFLYDIEDSQYNIEELVDYYNENIYNNYTNANKIFYETVYLSTDVKLLDWILIDRNTKKYNI